MCTLERRALGSDFEAHGEVWHSRQTSDSNPNILRLQERLETRLPGWRAELLQQPSPSREDLQLYRDVAYYTLYNRWEERLLDLLYSEKGSRRVTLWEIRRKLEVPVSSHSSTRCRRLWLFGWASSMPKLCTLTDSSTSRLPSASSSKKTLNM